MNSGVLVAALLNLVVHQTMAVEDIATAAMDCLLRRAERRDQVPRQPMHVMHRPVLIRRGSTAAPQRIRARA